MFQQLTAPRDLLEPLFSKGKTQRERERERERETIFMDVGCRIAINLLEIFQQLLQTPGQNRKLNQRSWLVIH